MARVTNYKMQGNTIFYCQPLCSRQAELVATRDQAHALKPMYNPFLDFKS